MTELIIIPRAVVKDLLQAIKVLNELLHDKTLTPQERELRYLYVEKLVNSCAIQLKDYIK